ncbi:MAG TPA: GNAT family N-acetyltransferase [Candidatus Limnocylindrales bacterium]|nr:GNAT family N-acetyltransferase [Candidatus Limnocylindrales bacterium]
MTDFDLRPMEPGDGPAIDALMREDASTTGISLTTHFQHDIYEALLAQHPTLFGVVATIPDDDGLAGFATAFTDEVMIGGRAWPAAQLENLKVRLDVRRLGLGARLAAWRIDEARRRFGGEGIIATGLETSNAASLATARRWCTNILGPVRVVIAGTTSRRPGARGLRFRALEQRDLDTVLASLDTFYAGYDLYPRMTTQRLAALLAPTPLGEPIRQYRVAEADDGTLVAGGMVGERFKLMVDELGNIPRRLELLSRVVPLLPRDRVVRTIEVNLAWHAPGRLDAGQGLWDAIRYEWHDRATHVSGQADPRGTLVEMFRIGRTMIPQIEIVIPVNSPVALDERRPVYVWR